MVAFETIPEKSKVLITFEDSPFGKCKLWIPEGIGTPGGSAGTYPNGMTWKKQTQAWNRKHPSTKRLDRAIKLGTIAPGETAQRGGNIQVKNGSPEEVARGIF